MSDLQQFYADHTAIAIALLIYVGLAGLICWPLVRRPFARWWQSEFIRFFSGSGMINFYWVTFELIVFIISCVVGSLGGWIFVILKAKNAARGETPPGQANNV